MLGGSIDPSPLYYDPVAGKFTPIKPLGRGSPKRNKTRLKNGSSALRYPSSYSDEDKGERRRRRGRGRKDDALATRRRARSLKRNSASTSKASGRVKDLSCDDQRSSYHHVPSLNSHSPKSFPLSMSSNLTTSSSGVSVPSSPSSTDNSPLYRHIAEAANDDVDSSVNSTTTLVLESASQTSFCTDIPSDVNITIVSDVVPEAAYPSPSSSCYTFSHSNQAAVSSTLRTSSHGSNILDRIAPFVALDVPSEIQLDLLPDDSSSIERIERILVEQRRSINCFITVAAMYKRKGMPEIAESIGMAGMRLWESKANDHPSLVIPMLLFLASLCVDTAQSQGSAGKGKAYQGRAIAYLRDFESLDSERWQRFRAVAMADKKSNLHDIISSEFRGKEAEIQSNSVTDIPSLAAPDLLSMKTQLQRERASKRKAEDNHFEAVLSRRRLEDNLIQKEEKIRHLEDEVDGLHAELIVFGVHP